MKFLVVFAILMAASMNVEADKSLATAMEELRRVLQLHSWVAAWNVRRNADFEVCAFSNDLNADYPAAFARMEGDAVYQSMRNTMIAAGVPWQDFIDLELKPAVGVHALVPSCTTLEFGRVAGLTAQLRGYFDKNLVDTTVAELKRDSTAFRQLHEDFAAEQAHIRTIRCSAEVSRVSATMRRYNVDFDFIYEVVGLIFGWTSVDAC